MNANPNQLLTTNELARRLHVSLRKVRKLTLDGRIPCIAVGGSRRFDWSEVVRALREEPPAGEQAVAS